MTKEEVIKSVEKEMENHRAGMGVFLEVKIKWKAPDKETENLFNLLSAQLGRLTLCNLDYMSRVLEQLKAMK